MVEHSLILLFLVTKVATINFPPLNLYIGTGGDGYGAGSLPLIAQSPYGALRLGADTSDTVDLPIIFDHFGGYHYSDHYINVFHIHIWSVLVFKIMVKSAFFQFKSKMIVICNV
jgi:hypothetical protein